MEPSTIIQLRKQLESLKQFRQKNAPNRLSYIGYIGELLVAVYLLGQSITIKADAPLWAAWVFLAFGLALLSHSLYLIFRYHNDKRVIAILEALFSESDKAKEQ
ncbi:MAG: hypothetical protein ACRDGA_11540 [Bacteroidota bacterium]